MSYDIRVMNSQRMGAVWRAANNLEYDADDVDIRKVCSYISKWTDGYEDNRRRHLSLRTALLLINGAVQVHKKQLKNLYDETVQLWKEVIQGRQETLTSSSNTKSKESTQQASDSNEFSSRKRKRPSEIASISLNTVNESQDAASRTYIIGRDEDTSSSYVYVSDKETQTSREDKKKKKTYNKTTKEPNMGFLMVFDNVSRVPTKIICSEVDMNVLAKYNC